jgi:hypothetical protein
VPGVPVGSAKTDRAAAQFVMCTRRVCTERGSDDGVPRFPNRCSLLQGSRGVPTTGGRRRRRAAICVAWPPAAAAAMQPWVRLGWAGSKRASGALAPPPTARLGTECNTSSSTGTMHLSTHLDNAHTGGTLGAAHLPRRAARRHSALTIQRHWRGYCGRRRFAAAREAKDRELRQVGGSTRSGGRPTRHGQPQPLPLLPLGAAVGAAVPLRAFRSFLSGTHGTEPPNPRSKPQTPLRPAPLRPTLTAPRPRSNATGAATGAGRASTALPPARPTWRLSPRPRRPPGPPAPRPPQRRASPRQRGARRTRGARSRRRCVREQGAGNCLLRA